MNLPQLAVHRPISTLMASIIIALLGWVALTELSVDLMPDLEFPTVTVTTLYPGAGPQEVETLITRPLEQVLSSVSGFEQMSSRSIEGSSVIRVQFQWGADLDVAVDEMRQSIDKVRQQFPDDVDLPYLRRYDANDSPVLYLGLNSELPATQVTRLAETTIIPQLERLEGVARVSMRGNVRREIHVDIDRDKLEALGLGVNQVVTALQEGNISKPAGDFEEGHLHRLIRSRSEFQRLDEIRSLVIQRRGSTVVRISDVAEVVDSHERITQRTRTNGQAGIMVYVFKQAGANTIDVSDSVHEAVAELNEELRNSELVIRLDKSDYIRHSIDNLKTSALFGMGLAMAILVLFLKSFRSTIVIGISMPLSVLGAFVLIYFKGYTLNMVSFGGLALGIGMLVDNSIVVLESIFRKREEGFDSKTAAVEGTNEVAGAITASTITTLIVFLPLVFTHGMTGILLHQLAFVVCGSMVCSLFVSLTLTPALAAYWLKTETDADRERKAKSRGIGSQIRRVIEFPATLLHRASEFVFRSVEQIYSWVLVRCLKAYPITGCFLIIVVAASLGLIPRIGTDFLPKTDDGRLGITGEMAPGIQLNTLDRQAAKLEAAIEEHIPEVETNSLFIGDEADEGEDWNQARAILQLAPRDQRTETAEEIRSRFMKNLPPIAGMTVSARVYGGLPISRMFSSNGNDNIAIFVRGHDRSTADQLAEAVMAEMKEIPGLVNVEKQMDKDRPELMTVIDRQKASHMGVTVQTITETLETTFRGREATVFRVDGDEYNVLVRLDEKNRSRQADLDRISLTTEDGGLVSLGNLVSFQLDSTPLAIDRVDRQRVIIISASSEGRDLGAVVGDLKTALAGLAVPDGFRVDISGDWEEQQESFTLLVQGFLLAVVLMYMVMAAQFESLTDPLLILFTIPVAAVGVILVLVFWDTTLNVQSFIGLIVLAGVVVNNAIVLVDYAKKLRVRYPEQTPLEITRMASVRRFRPIVMTTLTTVLGMLPVAFGIGEGGELQAPVARVVIGGLLSGSVITLILIPLVLRLTLPEGQVVMATDNDESVAPVPVIPPQVVNA
ncbi:efflux RND transporter permease subunit [Thalassoglobus sp. JC818]|uniref:efflux RND transporter permease subunit n=1 Tax=Thalassoglobus sp. JC818 TaxID=3232136 RepID=UPI00345A66EE